MDNGDRKVFEESVYEALGVRMRSGKDSPDLEDKRGHARLSNLACPLFDGPF
jgi:hypothetical protein